MGEGRAEGRFEALHGQRLTPLGRARARACDCCSRAGARGQGRRRPGGPARRRAGHRQVAPAPGAAPAPERRAAHRRSATSARPTTPHSALYPVIAQLERAAGFAADDAPEAKVAPSSRRCSRQATDAAGRGRAATRGAARHRGGRALSALNLSPQRQKQRTLEVLVGAARGACGRASPVLALYEDVHWVDPVDARAPRSAGRAGAARCRSWW